MFRLRLLERCFAISFCIQIIQAAPHCNKPVENKKNCSMEFFGPLPRSDDWADQTAVCDDKYKITCPVPFDTEMKIVVLLLDHDEFKCIEKIKTISTTYMAASGLAGKTDDNLHVVAVANFAKELLTKIQLINEHSFNNFNLRIVNVASRMDSSGVAGKIQVTDETRAILEPLGFEFECRGEINVKGKGLMTTHFLKTEEL